MGSPAISLSPERIAFYNVIFGQMAEMERRRLKPARIRCGDTDLLFFKLETGTGAPVEPLPVFLDPEHDGAPVVETEDGRDARGEATEQGG